MSWFNRKPKNRRLARTHVLDVKLRSEQVRASRTRLVALALGLVFATVLGFYLIWRSGEFALNHFIYENKSFAMQDIDVHTDGVIAPEQLRKWAGVKPGENLLALDLARVKRDLEMVPMIRTVAVERVLPHTLRLRVSERDPLAEVRCAFQRPNGVAQTSKVQLDADGFVMTELEPRQRAVPQLVTNDYLPVISGLNPGELVPGRRIDSAQARAALQLISAFEHSQMSTVVDLDTIDVSSPQVLQVRTTQGSRVTFSLQDMDRQLRRWRALYDQGQRLSKAIATLDLSVPSSIPTTWIDASAAPKVGPRNHNLKINRNKNV